MVINSSEARKGRFLWMPDPARKRMVEAFKKRINSGYYSSEKIAETITEKLAPAFDSELDRLV